MTDDISKVVREMRLYADDSMDASRLGRLAQHWANRLESATTPAEVGERHVRHEGGGVIALYEGDQRIREIGVAFTTGWDHRDRDEFIVRYNDYATLARQLAEAKAANELLRDRCRDHARLIDDFAARSEQAESQLAEATRRLGEVEGLVGKWRECAEDNAARGELIQAGKAVAYTDCADELEAALTKEPAK